MSHPAPFVFGTPEWVVEAISRQDTEAAAAGLRHVAQTPDAHGLPREFLRKTSEALATGDWDLVSGMFVRREFIGPDGNFLLLGPYRQRRLGCETTKLTAIYGRVMPHQRHVDFEADLSEICGPLSQHIPEILPITVTASCGLVGSEEGEAFVIPDGWQFAGSVAGPPLNDMGEQRRRLDPSGFECMRRIFVPETAELLIGSLSDERDGWQMQHAEYSYHDAGHASGYGLERKLVRDLIPTTWLRAVEEWRADGVEFELALRRLPPAQASQIIAANFCIRFGIDAHRAGGMEADVDVNTVLLMFDCLFRGDSLEAAADGRLRLTGEGEGRLIDAIRLHRDEAMQLTLKEVHNPESDLVEFYQNLTVSDQIRELFRKHVIEPCRGVFSKLP